MSAKNIDTVKCRTCGCSGNQMCGHEPAKGHRCELDATLQCYCCRDKKHILTAAIKSLETEIEFIGDGVFDLSVRVDKLGNILKQLKTVEKTMRKKS